MKHPVRATGLFLIAALMAVVVASLTIPGCIDQVQDNSPISISNSQGRPALSVTCSVDGSIAYVTDGRNVYRYDRNASGAAESWECILSQGRRLEMAAKHDPREPLPQDGAQPK
jgi:hypothetical protein